MGRLPALYALFLLFISLACFGTAKPVVAEYGDPYDDGEGAQEMFQRPEGFKQSVVQDGLVCECLYDSLFFTLNHDICKDEIATNPAFPDYQLRITQPRLCDPSVQQYSGYLDISDGKHLFFWQVWSFSILLLV